MFLPANQTPADNVAGGRLRFEFAVPPKREGLQAPAGNLHDRFPRPVFRAYEIQPWLRAARRRRNASLTCSNLLNAQVCEYHAKLPDMKTRMTKRRPGCRSEASREPIRGPHQKRRREVGAGESAGFGSEGGLNE